MNTKTVKPLGDYMDTIDSVWAFIGAAVAHRVNEGEYVKMDTPSTKKPNKLIASLVLKGEIEALQEDIEFAEQVRIHIGGFMLKLVTGDANDFEKKALSFLNSERVNRTDLALIASLPSGYVRAKKLTEYKEKLQDSKPEHIGTIGEKVNYSITVIRSRYSDKYNCYFTTAVTSTNHVIFFSQSKNPLQIGTTATVTGTVKAHRDEWQTQLSRVKII